MLGVIVVLCYNLRMTVAFIGHRKIDKAKEFIQKLKEVVNALIDVEGADTFLFGSRSVFNELSLDVVSKLKEYYPLIKRVYVRAEYEFIDELYTDYLLMSYDETFFPKSVSGAGYRSYVKRNQVMIDMCDVLITYYDRDYRLLTGKMSGTKYAVEYAMKKHKRIINLNEL